MLSVSAISLAICSASSFKWPERPGKAWENDLCSRRNLIMVALRNTWCSMLSKLQWSGKRVKRRYRYGKTAGGNGNRKRWSLTPHIPSCSYCKKRISSVHFLIPLTIPSRCTSNSLNILSSLGIVDFNWLSWREARDSACVVTVTVWHASVWR